MRRPSCLPVHVAQVRLKTLATVDGIAHGAANFREARLRFKTSIVTLSKVGRRSINRTSSFGLDFERS